MIGTAKYCPFQYKSIGILKDNKLVSNFTYLNNIYLNKYTVFRIWFVDVARKSYDTIISLEKDKRLLLGRKIQPRIAQSGKLFIRLYSTFLLMHRKFNLFNPRLLTYMLPNVSLQSFFCPMRLSYCSCLPPNSCSEFQPYTSSSTRCSIRTTR